MLTVLSDLLSCHFISQLFYILGTEPAGKDTSPRVSVVVASCKYGLYLNPGFHSTPFYCTFLDQLMSHLGRRERLGSAGGEGKAIGEMFKCHKLCPVKKIQINLKYY